MDSLYRWIYIYLYVKIYKSIPTYWILLQHHRIPSSLSISRFVFSFSESEKPGFHILIWAISLCTPSFHGHPLSPCIVSSPSVGSDFPFGPHSCLAAFSPAWALTAVPDHPGCHTFLSRTNKPPHSHGTMSSSVWAQPTGWLLARICPHPTWASHHVQALPIHGCHLHTARALTPQACPHSPGSLFTLQVPPPTRPLLYARPTLLWPTCLPAAWTGRGGKKMERKGNRATGFLKLFSLKFHL